MLLMEFDPFDPIDPLGLDVPFEMQNPSSGFIDPGDLKLASDNVLRRAEEQATCNPSVPSNIVSAISSELDNRRLEAMKDEIVEPPAEMEWPVEVPSSSSESTSGESSSNEDGGYIEDYTESYTSSYKE